MGRPLLGLRFLLLLGRGQVGRGGGSTGLEGYAFGIPETEILRRVRTVMVCSAGSAWFS
jgi:hypothetical protein